MKLTESALDRRLADKRETRGLIDLLLSTGAMTGPYIPVRPLTVTPLMRLRRALRRYLSA